MKNLVFDNDKYIKRTAEEILKRKLEINDIKNGNSKGANKGKVYIEVGGKLFDDLHAKRVIPGFKEDNKIRIIETLKDEIEIIITVANKDIKNEKIRIDKGMDYNEETISLINNFGKRNINIAGLAINRYKSSKRVDEFVKRVEDFGIKVYKYPEVKDFAKDISHTVSKEGLGKVPYIPVKKDIVVVTAPGPSSGKMFVCISQVYNEAKKGLNSDYFKLETFPVADLPVNHLVNIAYESATADIEDKVMVDPFYYEKYGIRKTNYNRDIENFSVLKEIMEKILNKKIYSSPTEMCVNVLGECIINDKKIKEAAKEEIIRRYYKAMYHYFYKNGTKKELFNHARILKNANIKPKDSQLIYEVLKKKEYEKRNCNIDKEVFGFKLSDGQIIIGKEGKYITASAAALLNALKVNTEIEDEVKLIPEYVLDGILKLKKRHLKNADAKLDAWDCIIASSIIKKEDEQVEKAFNNVDILKNSRCHSTYIISNSDMSFLKDLKADITFEI